jgi:hypothetical protein
LFAYSDTNKTDSYIGKFNFVPSVENSFVLSASGYGKGSRKTGVYDAHLAMVFDFMLTENSFRLMAKDFNTKKAAIGLPAIGAPLDSLVQRIGDLIGQKPAEDFQKRYGSYLPLTMAGPKLAKGIVLSDINLTWSPTQNAWHSVGQIGLSNINRYDVNILIDGYVEIKKGERGDIVKVVLQISPDSWYYFSFDENSKLYTICTDNEYNAEVSKNSKYLKSGRGIYGFGIADDADRVSFVKSFNKDYLGKEVEPIPFSPSGGIAPAESAPETTEPDDAGLPKDSSVAPAPVVADSAANGVQPKIVEEKKQEAPLIDPITGQPVAPDPASQKDEKQKDGVAPPTNEKPKDQNGTNPTQTPENQPANNTPALDPNATDPPPAPK